MALWLGPVFQAEFVGLARRKRFFVTRFLYGLLVLLIVSTTYNSMASRYMANFAGVIPIHALAQFGQQIFSSFAVLQGLTLLVMTPSLVAGTIADEKQRKTLHYLMASELSSTEIVLGKMVARLLQMAVLGALGLPVLALVGLFGGVDYQLVFLVYLATATTTFLIASFAILCSVYATKPRDAIMQCFFYEFLWLFIPNFALQTIPYWNPGARAVGEFLAPVIEWVEATSPMVLTRVAIRNPTALFGQVCWMMGLQVGVGLVLLLFAAWRLRPVYRGMDGPGLFARLFRRGKGKRPRLRLFRRPPIGDDAMLWKELHVARTSDFRKIMLALACVSIVGSVVYLAWDEVSGATLDALYNGYWSYSAQQHAVNGILRGGNAVGMTILLIGLASTAATSITGEREGDTWINLASSPIEGGELIRSKILGNLWLFRPLFATILACWVFGLLIGSIRPLGIAACLVELAVFAWFTSALGVAISLRSKTTVGAMALTFGILLFTNAGYLFLIALMVPTFPGNMVYAGCMPTVFTMSLVGGTDFASGSSMVTESITACIGGTLLYAFAAAGLTYLAMSRYDAVVDRPDRRRNQLTPEKIQALHAQPATKTPRPAAPV